MAWISENRALTQSEMENNADIIINYYRSINIADETIAAILGNMQAESTISPVRTEAGGGGGYGLCQWTPRSVLEDHCSILGLSPYTSGDVQLQVLTAEVEGNPGSVNKWYTTAAFIQNYYNSGATSDMIGVTGSQFLSNTMQWAADKLAIMFMAGYERPTYDPALNHYDFRMAKALEWFTYMGGIIPPTPGETIKKKSYNFVLFNTRRRIKKQ